MAKILGIICSPRRLGNCELMVKEIGRHLPGGHSLELLRLSDFDIQSCTGCYRCLVRGNCVIDDQYELAARAFLEAEALIVAAPTYFLGPNSSLKRFLDRGMSLFPKAEKMWGKPAVGIAVAGIEGKEGYTDLALESFLKLALTDLKQVRTVYGALPGEVFLNEDNKEVAKELAVTLFAPRPTPNAPCCNLCGGTSFRFLEDNNVRCLLCSHTGTLSIEHDQPNFQIEKGGHALFLTLKDSQKHGEWLRGMKVRFRDQVRDLREITASYEREGVWVRPSKKTT